MLAIDSYALRARVAPAVIVSLPAFLTAMAWFPHFRPDSIATGVGAWAALAFLAGQLGRDQGKKKEPDLFRSWGGAPATAMLRHRDKRLNSVTRARYREKLSSLLRIELPSAGHERDVPRHADEVYESCIQFLREKTRDRSRFPLVLAENISYGFRRNLWGMRPSGIAFALLGTVACAVRLWIEALHGEFSGRAVFAVSACSVLLTFWILRFTRAWVRTAAESYSRAVLAACEELDDSSA